MSKPVRILIVEEERVIAMDLEHLLVSNGYRVLLALRSAEDAIAYSRINKPDVIILDSFSGGTLTGYKAADIFLRMDIPVIVLDGTLPVDYEAAGGSRLIKVSKPFIEEVLLNAVKKLTGRNDQNQD